MCPNGRRQYILWADERYTTSAVGTASSDSGVINLFLTMTPDYLDTFFHCLRGFAEQVGSSRIITFNQEILGWVLHRAAIMPEIFKAFL
jgi:hypothetical protein